MPGRRRQKKNAAAEAAAPALSESLELDPRTQLDLPGGVQEVAVVDPGGGAKQRVEVEVVPGDGVPAGVYGHDVLPVGDVEEIRKQFNFVPFADAEVLGH